MANTTANRAETPRRRAHLGARWRLTLWFTGLFVVIGAVLLGLNYYLVQRSYHANPDEVRVAVADELGVRPGDVHSGEEGGKDDDRDLYRKVQAQLATDHLDELLSESALALVVMAAASFGVSWVLAGRVLRPVHTMTTTARQLSESNLHERIALEGPDDELKELADTFDAMLARLEAAFAAQRRFVADASHELRTPLAIIRAEIDVTLADPDASRAELRAMAETVRDATERSEHLIDSLLVLARSDAAALASEHCDLAAVARLAADAAATEVRVHHLDLDLSLHRADLIGDPSLLERAVANLVQNAVRHNVEDGWVSVETRASGGTVSIRVANSGTQLDETAVDELFERFHRTDEAQARETPGFGLGLSIVAAVATAHRGTVRAVPLTDGGLAVTVTFPAAPADDSVWLRPGATGDDQGRVAEEQGRDQTPAEDVLVAEVRRHAEQFDYHIEDRARGE